MRKKTKKKNRGENDLGNNSSRAPEPSFGSCERERRRRRRRSSSGVRKEGRGGEEKEKTNLEPFGRIWRCQFEVRREKEPLFRTKTLILINFFNPKIFLITQSAFLIIK